MAGNNARPGASVVDTNALNAKLNKQVQELELSKKTVAAAYKDEAKAVVQGSPMYRPFFGNTMSIVINGVSVYVPLDGQQYSIPETFAAVFHERIAMVDEQERIRRGMANVQQNSETYAGEKGLITRA